MRLGLFGDLNKLERAKATWLLEDRALGRWKVEACKPSAACRESFRPSKFTPMCQACDELFSDMASIVGLCLECIQDRPCSDRRRQPFMLGHGLQ